FLDIDKETDVIGAECADPSDVLAYETNDHPWIEPTEDNLKYDWMGSADSYWNRRVVQMLLLKYREAEEMLRKKGDPLPSRSNDYIDDIIESKLARLRSRWRKGLRRTNVDGDMESEQARNERVLRELEEEEHAGRRNTRREKVSHHLALGTTETDS